MLYRLESFSEPSVTYATDKSNGHCSCPHFMSGGWCKHLECIGAYRPRRVTLTQRPSYSQALSAVVKGIRLRDVREAAYWFKYCWEFRSRLAGSQFRAVRRLLIGAAEDGHSVAVMERVAEHYAPLLAPTATLTDAFKEILRICRVPNWWQCASGGHNYLHASLIAERRRLYDSNELDLYQCLRGIETAIETGDSVQAIYWVLKVDLSRSGYHHLLADKLLQIALRRNHVHAIRLIRNIYCRHSKSLTRDNNFTCQAAWLLTGGNSPYLDDDPWISQGDVAELLDKVLSYHDHVIPGWCCDGIHCAGNDTRYAGLIDRMYAVCQQFNHYGSVSPEDEWQEDKFYSLEGIRLADDGG